ncbi:hypothetical protein LXL04_021886 [Taraxacum kok-saghyz]
MVSIWKLRNGAIFEKKKPAGDKDLRDFMELSFFWLSNRNPKFKWELAYRHLSLAFWSDNRVVELIVAVRRRSRGTCRSVDSTWRRTEKTQAKKKRRRKESLVPLRSEKGLASERKGFAG